MLLRSLVTLALLACSANATILNLSNFPLLATYKSYGQYDLSGLEIWNGQPLSPTNMPNADNRLLTASFNLYRDPVALNLIYVQVTDVVTTLGAFWNGTAFENVTLTGVALSNFPTLDQIGFSRNFANPGEIRAFGGASESTMSLDITPGYEPTLPSSVINAVRIHTSDRAENGFTSLTNITGASRIRGGGLFQLSFAPFINVAGFDFQSLRVQAEYGSNANQVIDAVLVPEPSSYALLGGGLLAMFLLVRSSSIITLNRSKSL